MKKWSYRIEYRLDWSSLNTIGEQGWELVTILMDNRDGYKTFYFKKEKNDYEEGI